MWALSQTGTSKEGTWIHFSKQVVNVKHSYLMVG